ncbi:MAG: class I SAM-dependent methyltransferase [Streptosporangiaceae bacterium]
MSQPQDTNAAIWQSEDIVTHWAAEAANRERYHVPQQQFMAELLPFGDDAQFTFVDLGAGAGALSKAILERYPRSTAILADFSDQMMGAGAQELQPFADRYRYVTFDMSTSSWPAQIPGALDAIVSSLFVHHVTDERKQSLFAEIFGRLVPGGWSVNYDPVTTDDPVTEETWRRVGEQGNPEMTRRRLHPTPEEHARWQNHIRYMIPLDQLLSYLREAGFGGVDMYFKRLEWVIYGGCKPGE